jgi:hypothetical protein
MFTGSSETFRKRTPGEAEELGHPQEREHAERYRGVYTNLDLRAVAHEDGTLELTWKAGEDVGEVCFLRRCRDAVTIS